MRDPDLDCRTLDHMIFNFRKRAGSFSEKVGGRLEILGRPWSDVSSSPLHIAMYSPTSADLDSNGWPNRQESP